MASDAEKLLNAIPILSYIQRYVPLKQKGNNYWGLCPFHGEKTPSFSVNPEKGIFKCFGCGKGGNLITFVKEYDKVDFVGALRILSDFSGIELEGGRSSSQNYQKKKTYYDILAWIARMYQGELAGSPAQEYLLSRKVTRDAVEHFQLGFAPPENSFPEKKAKLNFEAAELSLVSKALLDTGVIGESTHGSGHYQRFGGRLIFPIRDQQGRTCAFGGRLVQEKENSAKYLNSPESEVFHKGQVLFHLYEARESIRKNGMAIVVEGYFDVLGLYQAGIENSVAPLGTSLTEDHARLLKRFTDRVLLFFDQDNAGREAAFRSLKLLRKENLEVRVINKETREKLDPFDLAQKMKDVELLSFLDSAAGELEYVLWYFFHFHYDISIPAQKQRALHDFFNEVRELDSEIMRDEYLSAAADVLRVDAGLVRKDFRNFAKGGAGREKPVLSAAPAEIKEEKENLREKEILFLLLRYPDLWNQEKLLELIEFSREDFTLLFSFFRDRLHAGELWQWEKLNEVISFLSDPALEELLSGLLLHYDDVHYRTLETDPERSFRHAVHLEVARRYRRRSEELQKEHAHLVRVMSDRVEEIEVELLHVNEMVRRHQEAARI